MKSACKLLMMEQEHFNSSEESSDILENTSTDLSDDLSSSTMYESSEISEDSLPDSNESTNLSSDSSGEISFNQNNGRKRVLISSEELSDSDYTSRKRILFSSEELTDPDSLSNYSSKESDSSSYFELSDISPSQSGNSSDSYVPSYSDDDSLEYYLEKISINCIQNTNEWDEAFMNIDTINGNSIDPFLDNSSYSYDSDMIIDSYSSKKRKKGGKFSSNRKKKKKNSN